MKVDIKVAVVPPVVSISSSNNDNNASIYNVNDSNPYTCAFVFNNHLFTVHKKVRQIQQLAMEGPHFHSQKNHSITHVRNENWFLATQNFVHITD